MFLLKQWVVTGLTVTTSFITGRHWTFKGNSECTQKRKSVCWWLKYGFLWTISDVSKLHTGVSKKSNSIYRKQCVNHVFPFRVGRLVQHYLLHREGEVSWSALTLSDEESSISPLFVEYLFCFGPRNFSIEPPAGGRKKMWKNMKIKYFSFVFQTVTFNFSMWQMFIIVKGHKYRKKTNIIVNN